MLTNLEGKRMRKRMRAPRAHTQLRPQFQTRRVRPAGATPAQRPPAAPGAHPATESERVLHSSSSKRAHHSLLFDWFQKLQSRSDFFLRLLGLHSGADDGDVLPLRGHVVRGGDHADVDICERARPSHCPGSRPFRPISSRCDLKLLAIAPIF